MATLRRSFPANLLTAPADHSLPGILLRRNYLPGPMDALSCSCVRVGWTYTEGYSQGYFSSLCLAWIRYVLSTYFLVLFCFYVRSSACQGAVINFCLGLFLTFVKACFSAPSFFGVWLRVFSPSLRRFLFPNRCGLVSAESTVRMGESWLTWLL